MRRRLVGRDADLGQDLAGKRITLVGDVLHSRVARSKNVDLLHTLGAEVTWWPRPPWSPSASTWCNLVGAPGRTTSSCRPPPCARPASTRASPARSSPRAGS
ncbi:hypothetical protein STANM309S_04806 [Streptomyces tanashiensis]